MSEAQNEYNLVLAGFLPIQMIKVNNPQALVKIDNLLYGGGLRSYLHHCKYSQHNYLSVENNCYEKECEPSTSHNSNQTWQFNPYSADTYLERGIERFRIGDMQGAIQDYTQAIKINSNLAEAYLKRAIARDVTGGKLGAIKDYTQAIRINPKNADAYFKRGVICFSMGNKMRSCDDFQKASELYLQQGNLTGYQTINEIINTLISTDKIPF